MGTCAVDKLGDAETRARIYMGVGRPVRTLSPRSAERSLEDARREDRTLGGGAWRRPH
jgi:hypothetical protein